MRARLRLLALCLACAAVPAAAAPPAKAAEASGIAAFSRHARFVDARISPKGTHLAVVATEGGRRSLVFIDLASRRFVGALKADDQDMVAGFTWVNDGRVVAELAQSLGYLAVPGSYGELYAVDATGKNGRLIFGYRAGEMQTGSRVRKGGRDYASASILARERGDERHLFIETAGWRETSDPVVHVKRLDVYSGVQEPVTVGPIPGTGFLSDETGAPRLAVGHDQSFRKRWYHREPDGLWKELAAPAGLSGEPVGISAKARTVYFVEEGPGGFRLHALGIDDGARKLLAETKVAPPAAFVADANDNRILAVESEPDLPGYDVLDKAHPVSRALEGLLAAHPDDHVRLLNRTDDGKKAVVLVYSDRNPGQFLVVDLENLTAEPVAEVRPWIKPPEMAEKTAFHIKASDGVPIHGYVTLPRGLPEGVRPPLVVHPHGGPHFVRDHWGFDPEVQLLASQGFAVLQVNYRGSGGYGDAFEQAGFGKWGTRMVEDIVDATRYAIRKGWGDPGRICTYGGSYGGYAAVQMAIVAPELVRCAVGYAGVYDLRLLGKDDDMVSSRIARAFLKKAVGESGTSLDAMSPARNAAKLTAKVLLIHGKEDWRAPIDHAEALRAALVKAGRPPEWLVEPREGHGFYDEQARERMYTRLVAFLKENTAPLAAPPPAAAAPAGAGPAPAAAPAR